jgi:hypothetical protein
MLSLATVALLAGLTGACSWTRFGDLKENAPIVLVKKPDELSSFGVSLSTATLRAEKKTTLLVGGGAGVSRAATYALGFGDDPNLDSTGRGYCERDQDNACFLGTTTAGVGLALGPDQKTRNLCFYLGIGSMKGTGDGIVARCENSDEYAVAAPPNIQSALIVPAVDDPENPTAVALASDRSEEAALLVGAPTAQFSWVYGPKSIVPVELVPPGTKDPSYGERVAVLRMASGFVFAVAAPGQGRVWLFRGSDSNSVSETNVAPIGCLGGPVGFGRALAAGRVDDTDQDDDLVISDAQTVSVFDGSVLGGLPPSSSADCGSQALVADALQVSFTCGSTADVSGCGNSDFGAALAVGDLDGDGDGEVIVGAPRMTAREESKGGAVLIYDAEGPTKYALTEAQFLSSAEENDLLGASLTTPWIGTRHIIAAGAPGGGKTALFYCSRLLPSAKRGSRCQ